MQQKLTNLIGAHLRRTPIEKRGVSPCIIQIDLSRAAAVTSDLEIGFHFRSDERTDGILLGCGDDWSSHLTSRGGCRFFTKTLSLDLLRNLAL
jgi:hypothetical protein